MFRGALVFPRTAGNRPLDRAFRKHVALFRERPVADLNMILVKQRSCGVPHSCHGSPVIHLRLHQALLRLRKLSRGAWQVLG